MGKANNKSHLEVDDCDGFGSRKSQNEYCSTIQHCLLTQSWIQFDEKYGVSIDVLIGEDDPTAVIRQLKTGGRALQDTDPLTVKVVHTKMKNDNFLQNLFSFINPLNNFKTFIKYPLKYTKTLLRSCVAGFNGFKFLPDDVASSFQADMMTPIEVCHDTEYQTVFDSAKLFGYIAGQSEIPIIIDTGASIPLTPIITDFVGTIEPANLDSLQGLSSKTKVCGQGTVKWKVQDMFGVVRTLTTKAYYVPEASIRLMSPQQYFKEKGSGHARFDGEEMSLHLPNDQRTLRFPFHQGNNLPFMLLNDHPSLLPLTSRDVNMLCDIPSVLESFGEQTNQSLTTAQKELLL